MSGILRPVAWLPPFRLENRVLLDGTLEAVLPTSAAQPFAQLRPAPDGLSFTAPPGLPEAEAAAAAAGAAMRRLGDLPAWRAAVAVARAAYLGALDAGKPPPAEEVAALCRRVPHALRGLGNALPTAETIALLRPLGRVLELGAGMGLFARALERAGLLVAASDVGDSPGIGLAFPVRRGMDAVTSLDAFARLGGAPPPLLILWPRFEEGDWFLHAIARCRPGQHVALASPEFEFCRAGRLEALRSATPGSGWAAAPLLDQLLARDFAPAGVAPVVAAGWPAEITPLRLWQRHAGA